MVFSKVKVKDLIGLDLSTNSIAYGYFFNGELIEYGEYTMEGSTTQRLYLASRYGRAIGERLKPSLIAYEGAAYINNRKTVIDLAQFYGAIVSGMMPEGDTKLVTVPAMSWQNYIGNKKLTVAEKKKIQLEHPGKSATWYKNAERNERKQRTINWSNNRFGIDIDSPDVADAIGVGAYAYSEYGIIE